VLHIGDKVPHYLLRGGIPAPVLCRCVSHNVCSVCLCVLAVKEKRSKWFNLFRFTL
jgi:hypothetical protein